MQQASRQDILTCMVLGRSGCCALWTLLSSTFEDALIHLPGLVTKHTKRWQQFIYSVSKPWLAISARSSMRCSASPCAGPGSNRHRNHLNTCF